MTNFLIASSLFTNFLEILLSQENRFLTLCVHYPGAPSIFYSVLDVVCVCVACVANQWCWGGDGVMAMGPLVREGEGEWRVTAGDDRYGNG